MSHRVPLKAKVIQLLYHNLAPVTTLTPPQPSSGGSERISLKSLQNLMIQTEHYVEAGLKSAWWSSANLTGGGLSDL